MPLLVQLRTKMPSADPPCFDTAKTEIDPTSPAPDLLNLCSPSLTPTPPDNQEGLPAYEEMVS